MNHGRRKDKVLLSDEISVLNGSRAFVFFSAAKRQRVVAFIKEGMDLDMKTESHQQSGQCHFVV